MITGMAATIGVSIWSASKGSSVMLVVCMLLSGVHAGFCGLSSSALLCAACAGWLWMWVWAEFASLALNALLPGLKQEARAPTATSQTPGHQLATVSAVEEDDASDDGGVEWSIDDDRHTRERVAL